MNKKTNICVCRSRSQPPENPQVQLPHQGGAHHARAAALQSGRLGHGAATVAGRGTSSVGDLGHWRENVWAGFLEFVLCVCVFFFFCFVFLRNMLFVECFCWSMFVC